MAERRQVDGRGAQARDDVVAQTGRGLARAAGPIGGRDDADIDLARTG